MTDKIKLLINNLKHSSGVYIMHDKDDKVIYVGKAIDLYKRVSQYFLRPQEGKVAKMAMNVDYFETIIVNNEKEALVLEMNLIHRYNPKYNILLKDNSHYPYIGLTKKDDPYLTIKRNKKDKNYDYFGPYPNAGAAFNTISLLNKIYPIRKCKNKTNDSCLYYHLKQCIAPCINKIDEVTNNSLRADIKSFLNGNNLKALKEYETKMKLASDSLDYESALEYKKIVESIKHINAKQDVELNDKIDRDIFAYSSKNGYIALSYFVIRKGLLLDKKSQVVEAFGDSEEQVADLITKFYADTEIPSEIIINSKQIINMVLPYLNTNIYSVEKGKLFDLVLSVKTNADNALDEYFLSSKLDTNLIEVLDELGSLINVKNPYYIELFDNSHLQGSYPVGAMVAFINGEPAKNLYRKFKIEHEESRNDLESMKEVLFRHYSRLKENKEILPDLILVDGGENQIKESKKVIDELELSIPVFGLVKNDKHRTSSLMDSNSETYEINDQKLFFLLTRMQDEVHRFAISFHKDKRKKGMTVSLLDDIPGLGSKRKEIIYKVYKDINELKNASLEELEQLFPSDVAFNIVEKLKNYK